MKQLILDSSFIISAAKKKIDIFEELDYRVIIPQQVIDEIFRITQSNQSKKDKDAAELALKILEVSKPKFKLIDLGSETRKHTDNQLVEFMNENKLALLATLDKGIKAKFKGRLVIIRGDRISTA